MQWQIGNTYYRELPTEYVWSMLPKVAAFWIWLIMFLFSLQLLKLASWLTKPWMDFIKAGLDWEYLFLAWADVDTKLIISHIQLHRRAGLVPVGKLGTFMVFSKVSV